MNKNEIELLVKNLIEAKDAYYNNDTPILSDEEFDNLEEKLKEIDPENPYFTIVGTESIEGKKIVHPTPLLSMGKSKTIEGIDKWIKKLAIEENINFIIEPKIDGIAATCKYSEGKIEYIATRGNGVEGQDISHILKYVDDIKNNIDFTQDEIEIRGELYISKKSSFNSNSKPLRNLCAGLINRKENFSDLKHIKFSVYQIIGLDEISFEHDKLEILKKDKFNVPEIFIVNNISEIEEVNNKYLSQLRNDWEYETDGIIISVDDNRLFEEIDSRWVVDHHHHYAIALKPPAESKETTLENIEWQISRQGNLIPVALFTPVRIGGATLSRATLSNLRNVKNLNLSIGDTILIERANDVIPYVKKNLNLSKGDNLFSNTIFPSECPSCKSSLTVDEVHLKCTNKLCEEQQIQRIIFWVKMSEIDNVAEATIRTLFSEDKVKTIKDLYSIKEDDFQGIEGFKDKKINNFITEIKESKKMSAVELISKMGILLVQKKALKKIGINSTEDFLNFNDDTYVVGKNIIGWKENSENISLFNELVSILEITDDTLVTSKGIVSMTGKGPKPRKELISLIEKKEYSFSDTVTKETNILLCSDPNSNSSKLVKAKKLGCKLVTYDDFFID